MIKTNDIVLYKNEKHKVLYTSESGYCEVKKLVNAKYVEIVHRRELKPIPQE